MTTTDTDRADRAGGSFTAVLVAALDAAWEAVRARHPEVPEVILTMGSGTMGGVARWGHFAAERWQRGPAPTLDNPTGTAPDQARMPELFVGGEGLARGPRGVLSTLLHEAAHGLADARAVKDTSRQGRYHNEKFRALAEELGLHVEKDQRHGWTATSVPEHTVETYAEVLDVLAVALVAWRHAEPGSGVTITGGTGSTGDGDGEDQDDDGEEKPRKGTVVARCACIPRPRQFRITASVLDAGSILCGECEQEFSTDDHQARSVDGLEDGQD